MDLSTVIKLLLFLTTIIGNKIISVTNKLLNYSRYNCRCGEIGINTTNRITGGKFTEPHAYPWQALILRHNVSTHRYISPEDENICGGTIINNMYILTAAHCVAKGQEEKFEVVLGVHNRNNLRSKKHHFYKVVETTTHKNYHSTYSSDIAILKLNPRIVFNKFVKPICLQNQYDRIDGEKATVIGWGSTAYKGRLSDIKKEAAVNVLRSKQCNKHLRGTNVKYDYTMFCAFGGIHDGCGGDSGGSLFYIKNQIAIQVGIVSNGVNCGVYPGIYTKILIFLDWIYENTKHASYCKREIY